MGISWGFRPWLFRNSIETFQLSANWNAWISAYQLNICPKWRWGLRSLQGTGKEGFMLSSETLHFTSDSGWIRTTTAYSFHHEWRCCWTKNLPRLWGPFQCCFLVNLSREWTALPSVFLLHSIQIHMRTLITLRFIYLPIPIGLGHVEGPWFTSLWFPDI